MSVNANGSWWIKIAALFILCGSVSYIAGKIGRADSLESDAEIFEIVFSDFIESADECKMGDEEGLIFVDARPSPLDSGLSIPMSLRDNQMGFSVEPLFADLQRRAADPEIIRWQPSVSLGIVVTDLSARKRDEYDRRKYAGSRCHIQLRLPGYSRFGDRALMRFSWGPSPHGAVATYLVVRTPQSKSGWEILWRDFLYYA